jgi:arsenite methyltransferase
MAVHSGSAHLLGRGWALDGHAGRRTGPAASSADLFERTAPIYGFMREHLFRDDTDRIARALWPTAEPGTGTVLIELGCGPGLYARRLAARFSGLRAVGVDRSATLLALARTRAEVAGLSNCHFEYGDALALDWPDASADAVVASRLFTVVDAHGALAEIHRVLQPGGRCFLAEPVSALGTLLPFGLLRLAGWIVGPGAGQVEPGEGCVVPRRTSALDLSAAVGSRPWLSSSVTHEDGYLYAICQKPTGQPA